MTINLDKRYMKGAVVMHDGKFFKILREPSGLAHEVEESTEKAYRSRKGTIKLQSWEVQDAIGRVVSINGEFLRIEKVEQVRWGTNERFGPSGTHIRGLGHYVSAEKADKLRAEYEAKMTPVLAQREAIRRSQSDDARDWK